MTGEVDKDEKKEYNKSVGIYVTEEEAKLFMIFRQYQNIWTKIFGQENKNKKIILHFDGTGILRQAETTIIFN